jgi:hypothetical protein
MTAATSNRLPIIAAEVRRLHDAVNAAARTAVERAREAGTLLLEAKESVPHGGWLAWLHEVGISARTAQGYMQLARVPESECATVAHLGLRAALSEISTPRVHPLDEVELAVFQIGMVLTQIEEFDKSADPSVDWWDPKHEAEVNARLDVMIGLLERMRAAADRQQEAAWEYCSRCTRAVGQMMADLGISGTPADLTVEAVIAALEARLAAGNPFRPEEYFDLRLEQYERVQALSSANVARQRVLWKEPEPAPE